MRALAPALAPSFASARLQVRGHAGRGTFGMACARRACAPVALRRRLTAGDGCA
eukprot:CAMPEP_0170410220 /NCGR_PEP_ID=MMETSP0117_2-20130122/29764_1 /TAXON_ID=400756 /ORGANISM="Durinskia baltica, Strain CSIRO CS-38" /LENGTH=53 /DNA_ID=CAMNT_0010667719 /DNA_START=123 /DNA_END=280 /DNA_ORIENTATION=+